MNGMQEFIPQQGCHGPTMQEGSAEMTWDRCLISGDLCDKILTNASIAIRIITTFQHICSTHKHTLPNASLHTQNYLSTSKCVCNSVGVNKGV